MDIINDIKDRVSMRELLEAYGIYPKRGNNIYLCINHIEKNPSANIVKGYDKFHCFSCGFTGDIFDVVMLMEKCDLKTATNILDAKFNLGLLGNLSHKEKLELARKRKEREKAKKVKEAWERYEKKVINHVSVMLQGWEEVLRETHITRGEYKKNQWQYENLFFTALKKCEWYNWLYDVLCENIHPECEYDYIYGTNKKELLGMIRKGEIEVW
jgi:hypothetical protein